MGIVGNNLNTASFIYDEFPHQTQKVDVSLIWGENLPYGHTMEAEMGITWKLRLEPLDIFFNL